MDIVASEDSISPELRFQAALVEAEKRRLRIPPGDRLPMLEQVAGRRGLMTFKSFEQFAEARNPTLLNYEHVGLLLPTIEKIVRRELTRVVVLTPTQYLKSELFSRLLPAYYLRKHPGHRVALASYGADLAWQLSSEARDYYEASGGLFADGSVRGAARNWRTRNAVSGGRAGGMWATGVGGPQLGRGYNLGLVDDPVDPLKVKSRKYQRTFATWWPAKWLRGQAPGGAGIVFTMQRLDVDDPVAFIMELEHKREGTPGAHRWHILCYDELKSNEAFMGYAGPRGFPKGCTVEPDPRKEGDVLSPSYRDKEEVIRLQAESTQTVVAAQRQQRPMIASGDFWQKAWFDATLYDELPPDVHNVGWDWDTAYGGEEDESSASAGVKSGRGPGDSKTMRVYIEDVDWDWLEFPQLLEFIRNKGGPHYVEQKASGKSIVQTLKGHGIIAREVGVRGDKLARASAAQPVASQGRLFINRKISTKLLEGPIQGLLRITAEALREGAGGTDVNDAVVQAIWRHLDLASGVKRRARVGG